MPAQAARSSRTPAVVAPDGIAIHTFDLPAAAFVGVAEGRILPGRYGVHRHLSLEQYTYVLEGEVTAITGTAEHPNGSATTLMPGDLILTMPGESLQFINDGVRPARVLFICAPPYPPDDADTRTLPDHIPPTAGETEEAIARLEGIRLAFNQTIERRIAELRHTPPAG